MKVVRFPRDDAARLRGLLAMIERHAAEHPPVTFSREAMERAGFVSREPPQLDPDPLRPPDDPEPRKENPFYAGCAYLVVALVVLWWRS